MLQRLPLTPLLVLFTAVACTAGCKAQHVSGGAGGGLPHEPTPRDLSDDSTGGGTSDGGAPPTPPDDPCVKNTKLTGRILAPNGMLPLYNATVFVPAAPPPAFKEGVVCDRCDQMDASIVVTVTQTDASGNFTLEGVPAKDNVPLVVQMGKWRRQLVVPKVPYCQTTPVEPELTRLPKQHSEGDMPRIAIATGELDPFECLLLKIGIDPAEFTIPTGTGRVHFYLGAHHEGTVMAGAPREAETGGFFTSADSINKYDVVLLPCEGEVFTDVHSTTSHKLLVDYLNAGGRVFATHLNYSFFGYDKSPFNAVGQWAGLQPWPKDPYVGTLDTTFPKGKAFSEWLHNVAPMTSGSFEVVEPRNDLNSVDPKYAQRWIYNEGDKKVLHTTFNTPLDAPKDAKGNPQYCGRAVFSDFHVSASEATAKGTFPGACKMGEMTTQEKALAFMFFDLAACVAADSPIP